MRRATHRLACGWITTLVFVLAIAALSFFATPRTATASAATWPATGQANVIDGVAAVINGEVISRGEVARETMLLHNARLAPLVSGCGRVDLPESRSTILSDLDSDDTSAVLTCLIDGRLVLQEVTRLPVPAGLAEVVEADYEMLASSFVSREEFDVIAARAQLSPTDVRHRLSLRARVEAYVDARFRASVEITRERAQRHYADVVLPELRQRGLEEPPFDQALASVIDILREAEVNQRVESWLAELRERATIRLAR